MARALAGLGCSIAGTLTLQRSFLGLLGHVPTTGVVDMKTPADAQPENAFDAFGIFQPAIDYMVDATQRSVLFWDVMRQRGNQYHEHLAETAPHVLDYEVELVVDGRTLERPVNYCLVRVVTPPGV